MDDLCYTLAFRHPQIGYAIKVNYSIEAAFEFTSKDVEQLIVENVYTSHNLGKVLTSGSFFSRLQTLYENIEGVICIVPHRTTEQVNCSEYRIYPEGEADSFRYEIEHVDLKDELVLTRFVLDDADDASILFSDNRFGSGDYCA
tara:strand:- start:4488 stop:4919 length:432 start_codon:yes stop_codon:yes gene_type:complete